MSRQFHRITAVGLIPAIILISATASIDAQGGGSTFSTTNTVTELVLGKGIGGDGGGQYIDGFDCVTGVGGSQGGGVSKFKTVDNLDSACSALSRACLRFLIDLALSFTGMKSASRSCAAG